MFFPLLLIRLLLLPYRLYQWLTARGHATFDLEQWAEQRELEVFDLEPCGPPPYSVEREFPRWGSGGQFLYFRLTTVDQNHVRRSGFARVHDEHRPLLDGEQMVDFVWVTSEQLNWKDRPPRHSAEPPPDRAEGWYTDHTGAHELRWYSLGVPTNLVKDGEIESRDSYA
jgi:hypothetical protein